MLILVGIAPGQAYVVDLFRVAGGTRHEYTLLGDADHDGTLESDLPRTRSGDTLLPAGVKVRLPTGESVAGDAEGHNIAYAFVRDVWSTRPAGPWTARFTSEAAPEGRLRIHGLVGTGDRGAAGPVPLAAQGRVRRRPGRPVHDARADRAPRGERPLQHVRVGPGAVAGPAVPRSPSSGCPWRRAGRGTWP